MNEFSLYIFVIDLCVFPRLELRFVQATEEYNVWKSVLLTLVAEHSEKDGSNAEKLVREPEVVLKKGRLKMRPAKGGELWDDFNFTLTASSMTALDEITGTQVIETFHISPSCSVFETNLGRNAFELVTPKKVLHVLAESREITSSWIKVLRETIAQSELETNDPLLVAAIEKMNADTVYNTSFHEDKPLGVVLERSGEWAIVKLANERDTGVVVGSALMAVNNEDVMFAKYQETIGRLKNWRPPLTLTFLKSPEKRGFLVKESRGRHGNTRNWKRRFFVIEQGRIYYKEKEGASAEIKGDIPLMGSAVSLASSQETGKFFCFRLVSGVTCLVMQAETFDELMDWASTLYHAIGIANGGAHILRVEYEKRTKNEVSVMRRQSSDVSVSPEAKSAMAEANAKADEAVNEMVARERAKLHELPSPDTAAQEPPKPPMDETEEKMAADSSSDDKLIAEVAPVDEAKPAEEPVVEEVPEDKSTAASEALVEATSIATLWDFSALAASLEASEEAGVDEAVLIESRAVLEKCKKEYAVVQEINKSLVDAITLRSIPALQTALRNAEARSVANDNSAAATVLLAQLLEEQEAKEAEEKARLEAEAAALDAELAAEEEDAIASGGTADAAGSEEDEEELNVKLIKYCLSQTCR